ncbi:MAG: hypothetical protein JSR67_00590 [Proteobacteria bacterium]|nr:hypothetical protein [Pseudomonadota bacterium]
MRTLTLAAALMLYGALAWAQQPPRAQPATPVTPSTDPRPDQLEPAVDTSATPAPGKPAAAPADATAASAGDNAPGATSRTTAAKPAGARGAKGKKAAEHMALDTMEISGNRELPKVLFIVPWRHSDLGDLLGRPPNSLLDEVLQPLDRDVFRRENRYYDALQPDAVPSGGAGQAPAVKP